jgi:hypothetical protein
METELGELEARKAAAEAALTQADQRAHTLERAPASKGGASPSPSSPRERRPLDGAPYPGQHSCDFFSDSYNTQQTDAAGIDVRLPSGRHDWSNATVGYRIGAAAKEFRPFEGKEDGAAYVLELTHLLGTHEVPVAQWPRELSLMLKGSAAYAARFPDLPAGTFPPWSELHAAMLHAYSQS